MIDKALFMQNVRNMLDNDNCGDVSDGDHTFKELYHHRAILTMALFNSHPNMCWKSRQHHDGTMYDGYFIVGIDTPDGQVTYHYDLSYWSMFHVRELDRAPKFDGHTPDQAIERIATAFIKRQAGT